MMKLANCGLNFADLVDRISALPKSILSLDFKLDLCHKFCFKNGHKKCGNGWSMDEELRFTRYVNHVLLLHDNVILFEFRLVWKPMCIPSQVISWINTAIARYLLHLFVCVDDFDEPFEIPSSVFGCETLKSLKLEGNMFVSDSIDVCLPRLETIDFVSVYFQSDEAFQNLISGCPVLNSLSIKMDMDIMKGHVQTYQNTRTNLYTFIISSTSLRYFNLDVVSESDNFDAMPYCSLELEAPSLESLCITGFVLRVFVRECLTSLDHADFTINNICEDDWSDASFCNSLVEAVRAFDWAKELYLSEDFLSALSCASIGLSTKFKRLTKLKIGVDCCYCSSLQDFIQSSDNLQVLIVDGIWNESDYHYCPHSNWTTPVEVPGCLSDSLKMVEFQEYSGFDYLREMISYILMHGSVLEVMKINCHTERDDVKLKLLREICDFPRKSSTCKVKFI